MSATATFTIGGSSAAAACGLDPFRSRVQLWLEATGRVEPKPAGEAAWWGTVLQPIIAEETGRRGYAVMPAPADPIVHPESGFMHAHLDGWVTAQNCGPGAISSYELGTRGIFEAKTCGARMSKLWHDDATPIPYVLQVQHYMAVTGLSWALVACLVAGQRLELRTIERDEATITLLTELEAEFVGLVDSDTPPDPDGSASVDEMLALMYSKATGGAVVFGPREAEWVAEYRKLVKALAATQSQKDEVAQRIKLALGEAGTGLLDGYPVVTWNEVTQQRLDQAALKAAHPSICEEFTKPVSYRRFLVKGEK